MDQKLSSYLKRLRNSYPDKSFPNFCSKYSGDIKTKRILAVLQDPGGSGPVKTNECSIAKNEDPTAKRTQKLLKTLRVSPYEVLFWNFYPFFGWHGSKTTTSDKLEWAKELRRLALKLKNLKVIVVLGGVAWDGMRYFSPIPGVPIIWTPHPSNRGVLHEHNKDLLRRGWKAARTLAQG